jgi:Na+/H+ antiporter NhaD/arsenite permease-like protein
LSTIGYLAMVSRFTHVDLGPTTVNVMVGIGSAILDGIPFMFAALTMNPEIQPEQWLLVALTAGVDGSMLSIGSAAGAALMGQARGTHTFVAHLTWTSAIALGYGLGIWVHLPLNT